MRTGEREKDNSGVKGEKREIFSSQRQKKSVSIKDVKMGGDPQRGEIRETKKNLGVLDIPKQGR